MSNELIATKRKTNFACVPNTVLEDVRLSWKGKGILCYLISKPDGWTVRVGDLYKRSTDGYNAVKSGLKELKQFGYMKVEKVKDAKGQMKGCRYCVSEEPEFICAEELHTQTECAKQLKVANSFHSHDNRAHGERADGDRAHGNGLLSKKDNNNTEIEKKEAGEAPEPPQMESLKEVKPKSKKELDLIPLPPELSTPETEEAWADFCQHCREIKKAMKPTSARKSFKKLKEWGAEAWVAAVDHSIDKRWTAIFPAPVFRPKAQSSPVRVVPAWARKRNLEALVAEHPANMQRLKYDPSNPATPEQKLDLKRIKAEILKLDCEMAEEQMPA